MKGKFFIYILAPLLLSGCNFASDFTKTQRMLLTTSFGNNEVMIYGGTNHNVYLGNINPSKKAPDSIMNQSSKYGNSSSTISIRNKNGKYGSETSPFSACNKTATNPPILKDKYDYEMGYFSLNPNFERRIVFLNILEDICRNR
ncbi:MAG: hypothetical protein M1561_04965 [Gammaproteobacteria bacterium]|nr:hypothetical protein [Gammaproteobacteria bacterium]